MKNKVYVARPDTWYKEGTICEFLCEITPDSGLFSGIKIVESDDANYLNLGYGIGDEFLDEEGCGLDEFDMYEVEDDSLYEVGSFYNKKDNIT